MGSWFYEKSLQLEPEVLKEIAIELRAIRLREGECLVCGNARVAEGCFESIAKILTKSKASPDIASEFIRLFGMSEQWLLV
jgi:hypothetical protein